MEGDNVGILDPNGDSSEVMSLVSVGRCGCFVRPILIVSRVRSTPYGTEKIGYHRINCVLASYPLSNFFMSHANGPSGDMRTIFPHRIPFKIVCPNASEASHASGGVST